MHEEDKGNLRQPTEWSFLTTSCHSDSQYHLKTGRRAPFSLFSIQPFDAKTPRH